MNRSSRIAALVAALLLAVGVASFAGSAGTPVPIPQEIRAFFTARGVDAALLDKPETEVPAAEWAKILAVLNVADDPDVITDDHDVLNSLVGMALWEALGSTTYDTPVYMDIGNQRWIHELVSE